MTYRLQHHLKKEHAALFSSFFDLFYKYLQIHSIPGRKDLVFDFYPAEYKNDIISWDWAWERTVEQMVWQALCDKWLHEQLNELPVTAFKCLLIKVFPVDSNEEMALQEQKTSKLIKGEGLATFSATSPKFKMEKLVLPDSLKNEIKSTISIIQNMDLIYNQWGFSEVDSIPRLILNFYGPAGTGKTMAAHCIADELGKKIIVANFAEIESKYVGDSPKNLENIFAVAEQENAVLFFDEADSFLGKRLTSLSSSSDQAVNSLRSKLLQLLEDHSGIVIFCTNMLKNYDKAFESRILRSLKFDLPDSDCRKKLIQQMIPTKVPWAEGRLLDVESLQLLTEASDGFSGRQIKNAILQVLCKGASDKKSFFTPEDFQEGFDSLHKEIESLKKERGELGKIHIEKLETNIKKKLDSGDFLVKDKKEQWQNSEEK